MAFTLITQERFTSDGTAKILNVPSSADYCVVTNYTNAGATGDDSFKFEWFKDQTPNGGMMRWFKSGGGNTVNMTTATTGGFTYITSAPVIEAQNANSITAITAASPGVVSQTNTYSENDILRIYNTTGMLQIAGMDFEISSVSGANYTLIGLRAAGFAAAATAGDTRRVSDFYAVEPQFLYVTEITRASSAVVRTSIDPSRYYVAGMKVRFSVPSSFGMTEINGLTGKITALSSANYTMTVDIDSSAFTAFAFPTSASSPTSQLFATVAPAGVSTQENQSTGVQTGYNFQYQPFRAGQFTPYMSLAGGSNSPGGAANDQLIAQFFKMEN